VRRSITKNVKFDSSYFIERKADENGTSKTNYIIAGVVVLVVGYLYYRRRKKKKYRKG